MKDVTETGIDDVIFGDAEEGGEWSGIRDVVGGKGGERIDLIRDKMKSMFLTKTHILNHNLPRIASTKSATQRRVVLSERIVGSTKQQYFRLYPLLCSSYHFLLVSNDSLLRKHVVSFQIH